MSFQSSSTTKGAFVATTMLALEVEGHGILNGHWGPEVFGDDTPLSRNQKFSQFCWSSDGIPKKCDYPKAGTMTYAFVNGAENRMDASLAKCDDGWSVPKTSARRYYIN